MVCSRHIVFWSLHIGISLAVHHDGKGHSHARFIARRLNNLEHDAPVPRSNVNGLVGGINIIASPEQVQNSMSISVSASTAAEGPLATVSSTPFFTTYFFSQTVVQVPVATVCPDTPASIAAFPLLPLNTSLPVPDLNTTSFNNTTINTTSAGPTSWTSSGSGYLINGTNLLPTGNRTILSNITPTSTSSLLTSTFNHTNLTTIPSPTSTQDSGIATARILLDDNGCQTIYSPITTAVCSTTLQPVGLPNVYITDCNQWVTFSSEARVADCSSTSASLILPSPAQVAGAEPTPSPDQNLRVDNLEQERTFYVAHWYDVARGGVPPQVRVVECMPASNEVNDQGKEECQTNSEIWSVSNVIQTLTRTSVMGFSGPVIATPSPNTTLTTTLSFSSTLTTTSTTISQTVVRLRLTTTTLSLTTLPDSTTTIHVTLPTTQTMTLEEITVDQTSTSTSTSTITQTKTVWESTVVTETRTWTGITSGSGSGGIPETTLVTRFGSA